MRQAILRRIEPVVVVVRKLMATSWVRAYLRFSERRGDLAAAATTYFAFLSIFPVLLLAVAIAAAVMSQEQVGQVTQLFKDNLPGVGDQIDMQSIVRNARSIGLISGASLLLTGLGWVDALRRSIRTIWDKPDQPGNIITRKLTDAVVLLGLGIVAALSATTTTITQIAGRLLDLVNLGDEAWARWLVSGLGFVIAVVVSALMLVYMLVVLARVPASKQAMLKIFLVAGIVTEAFKQLGATVVANLLEKNAAYGALALPIALLIWINVMLMVTLILAAWVCEVTLDGRSSLTTVDANKSTKDLTPVDTEILIK